MAGQTKMALSRESCVTDHSGRSQATFFFTYPLHMGLLLSGADINCGVSHRSESVLMKVAVGFLAGHKMSIERLPGISSFLFTA